MPRGGAFKRCLVTLQSSRLCTDICVPESRAQGPSGGLRVFSHELTRHYLDALVDGGWAHMLSHPEACHLTHLGRLITLNVLTYE